MSLCKAQPDSMQENPILIALGKDDGRGGRGSVTTKKTWGRERGEGDDGITKLKTNAISAAAERKQCLLLGEACLAAGSRGWVQHCGMTLLLNVFCLLSRQIQRSSVCTVQGRGAGERGGFHWETSSSRYCGAGIEQSTIFARVVAK